MNIITLLTSQIQKDPGKIVGPLTNLFGPVLDGIFEFIYKFTVANSFGLAIIFLTIVVRTFMLPLGLKQQRSMKKMQELTPEIEKIKSKFGKTKDPEKSQEMNRQIQALYKENNVNPFAGCLPIFIQLPIFITLNFLMNQPYLFISRLGEIYHKIAQTIMAVPNYHVQGSAFMKIAETKVPSKMKDFSVLNEINVEKIVNKITDVEWVELLSSVPTEVSIKMSEILVEKNGIEYFMGIDLTEPTGLFNFPGIFIPILAGLTTFLTSYLMSKKSAPAEGQAKTQQQIMLYGMPIMMGFMTTTLTAGVGIYWITSNVYQVAQQYFINKEK